VVPRGGHYSQLFFWAGLVACARAEGDLTNQLKRATLIGETTGGGSRPVAGHRIDEHFMIGGPLARAINPISKIDWEGTGVEPAVKIASADALSEAEKLAKEKLAAQKAASPK